MTPLKVKDVILFPTEFDPLAPVERHPFPRNRDSLNVFNACFTIDEFRVFWSQERVAFQWELCSERSAREALFNRGPDDELPVYGRPSGGRGKPRIFDWSFKFACRRQRPGKALVIGRGSVGTSCGANIRIQKPVGDDRVIVEYHWRHNHDDSVKARALLPLSTNEIEWIKSKVEEGLDWKGIKKKLRPSEELLQSLERDETAAPPGMLITYNDVRGAIYRQRKKVYQKASDITDSVKLWITTIHQDGGQGKFLNGVGDSPNKFLIAWSTLFQLKIMKDNDTIACIDSTHMAVKSLKSGGDTVQAYTSSFLFTILVKDRNVQKGIPIAYMFCNSESTDILRIWLTWLKNDCGLKMSKFMADCSVVESEALKQVFPNAAIYYSLFHVGQNWEKKLKGCSAKDGDAMQPDLNKVRVASSPEELTTLWNAFKNKFPQACSVITYIEKNWMTAEKISKWASFVRQDYQHVDTNNLIESWRNTLKKRHLGSERNVRADFLIYLLQEVTNTDFRIAYYKIRQGLQPLQLSEYDRERRAKAMALDFDTARNMVTEKMDERKFLVKSFTQPGAEYSVFVDMNRVLLLSCSCEDYVQQKLPCKHMYLVPRVYVDLEIKYGGDPILPQEPQETQEAIGVGQDFEPPLGSTLSPHLVLQLQATRAEHQEAQKRAREEEIAEAFQECEHELLVACEELIDVVSNGKKIRCTL